MTSDILSIIFIILLALTSGLQKVFQHISVVELKRRARHREPGARELYKLAAYGDNLRVVLWSLVIVSAALAFVFLGQVLSVGLALIVILFLLWLSFAWLPGSRISGFELKAASYLASPLAWILHFFHKPLTLFTSLAYKLKPVRFHTGIYERDDLLDLIEEQKHQPDNRVSYRALEMAGRALTFGEKRVEDIMVPRRVLTTVNTADEITPKLVDELHKSGQSRFLVYETKPDNIVGTLELADLIDLNKSGHISSYFHHNACYVHEDFDLNQTLDAFHKTGQHMFVVVNKFEDFVGIITIEHILEAITGEPLPSDFDEYHDRRLVAEREAAAEHIAREAVGSEPEPDLVAEVVE